MIGAALRRVVRRHPPVRRIARLGLRLWAPIGTLRPAALVRYLGFVRDWRAYVRRSADGRPASVLDWYPCLHDRESGHDLDRHYFYQDVWALGRVVERRPAEHVDVGSHAPFVGMLTAVAPVTFVDIRPLDVALDGYRFRAGSVLALPYADGSIDSLSCLHVAEHVGLGRYGDEVDPEGTRKACRELSRVLAPGGSLYVSMPIGRPRVFFNAHRVHTAPEVAGYFGGLRLREYSGIDDQGRFARHRPLDELDLEDYGCGLFWFEKPA